jgi:hypothetical protein
MRSRRFKACHGGPPSGCDRENRGIECRAAEARVDFGDRIGPASSFRGGNVDGRGSRERAHQLPTTYAEDRSPHSRPISLWHHPQVSQPWSSIGRLCRRTAGRTPDRVGTPGAGAVSLGALVTLAEASSALDITGVQADGTLAILGFFVIPCKRMQAMDDFKEKMQALRTKVLSALTTQFDHEPESALARLKDGVSPTPDSSAPSTSASPRRRLAWTTCASGFPRCRCAPSRWWASPHSSGKTDLRLRGLA